MGNIVQLLCILLLSKLCLGRWNCGGAEISDWNCLCGNVTITLGDYYNGINCCGPDSCFVSESGAGICPEGILCGHDPFPCGDIQISSFNECHCGTDLVQAPRLYSKFCCPSSQPSQCYMTPDGDGKCDGSVKSGTKTGCETGVCSNRDLFACRSGDECVKKTENAV